MSPWTEEKRKNLKPKAFFLSLVASTPEGIPTKEHYLYDVATEMELQGFQVKFLSSQDLKEFYDNHKEESSEAISVDEEPDIYQLVLFFIEKNPGGSFFMDEVPFIASDDDFGMFMV